MRLASARKSFFQLLLAGGLLLLAAPALAGTILGTANDDVLRGTAKADKLYGKAGDDRLLGLGGDDLLVGGPGNDVLRCGPGRDTALAGVGDTVADDCEVVKGLPKPALEITDATVAEGNAGTTTMSFTVTLSKTVTQSVSARYATADGSATAPADYTATSGTLTFAPGETGKTIDVTVVGDTEHELYEIFDVVLSNPLNATISVGRATGTILNDDAAPPPARPGHYKGMSSQLTNFEFDVTGAGTGVTHLRTGQINQTCGSGVSLYGGNLDFGSYVVTVTADGTFSIDTSWETTVGGDPADIHLVITGRFSGDTASGTLLTTISWTEVASGTHYSCTSEAQTWSVTRTG